MTAFKFLSGRCDWKRGRPTSVFPISALLLASNEINVSTSTSLAVISFSF